MLRNWIEYFRKKFRGADQETTAPTISESAGADELQAGTYSTDTPVNGLSADRFDRAPFAKRVAQTIAQRSDHACLVVGIYGPWGDGKTTTLNFISESLASEEHIVTLAFNPWRIAGEDALLESFFATLADGISVKLRRNSEQLGALIRKYSFLMKPVVALPGADSVAEGLGSALSSVSLEDIRKRISYALKETNKRLVILIDDIDRLEKSEIQALFRLIKLSADFENVAYILAFDDTMVAAALGERFESDPSKHYIAGQSFLEKIVQVGLNLPPSTPESLREYTFELVNRALASSRVPFTQEQSNATAVNFEMGILPRLKTPRMANRYANALEFSLALLGREVNSSDLILLEGMRIFYPTLYEAVRRSEQVLLGGERKGFKCEEYVAANSPTLTKSEQEAAVWLMHALFPRTKTTGYGSDWEMSWARDKRICSSSYFDRYFSYAIRANDVSDESVQRILDTALTGDAEATAQQLAHVISQKNAARVIEKLRAQETSLSPATSIALARGVATIGERLPTSEGMGFFSSPSLQGCVLIRRLISNLPPSARMDGAISVIACAQPIGFLCECVRWMSAGDEEKEKLLDKDEDTEMRAYGAQRMLDELSRQQYPIFESAPKDAGRILGMISWGLGPEAARNYVMSWLNEANQHIETFLVSFLPTAWTMETGIPHIADLRMDAYNEICKLADCEMIVAHLRALFGEELDNPAYYLGKDVAPLRKVAHQFMYLRAKALNGVKAPVEAEAILEASDSVSAEHKDEA